VWGDACRILQPTPHIFHGTTNLKETTEEKDLGIWIHKSLKVTTQCAAAVKKANRVLGMIKRNFAYRNRNVILKLYKSLVRPHLDYCMQVWNPYLSKHKEMVEKVQARATKLIPSLQNMPYPSRLANLNLTTLEDRRKRGDLIETYRIMHKIDHIDMTQTPCFNRQHMNEQEGTHSNSQKVDQT
jgi:hypothetical protein